MKNKKVLVPLVMAMLLFLSYYMLYTTRTETAQEYQRYLEAARNYAEQGIEVDAAQNYRSALAVKDTLALNLEVGEFYLKMADVNAAIGWGETVIEKYPKAPEAYAFLIKLYKDNTDYNRCFALYEKVKKRDLVSKEISNIMKDINYVYYLDKEFEDVGVYCNGYCEVQSAGKWGFVNERGSRTVSCQYESVGPFMSDVAPVRTEDGEAYYIDAEGNKKIVVNGIDSIVELSSMLNGVFAAYDGKQWTYYTSDFKKLSDGYDSVTVTGNMVAAVEKNGYFYLVDTKIKKINNEKYIDVIQDEKGAVYRNDVLFVKKADAYNMINKEGKIIGKEEYEDARLFGDQTYAAVKGKNGWYFIDNTGKKVFKDKVFQDARSFVNGYAAVKQNGGWGFIDMEGNVVIDCIFEDAKDFNASGNVFVKQEDVWKLLRLYSKNYES